MKNNGFAKAEPVNTMDPEYVKLQRAEVLKQYQDRVIELKNEIQGLEERKDALERDLKQAFIAERSKVEELERLAREKKEAASQEVSIVRDLRTLFEAEKKQMEEALAVREKDIQDKLEQNRAMLDAINIAHDKERGLALKNAEEAKALKDTSAELEKRILALGQDRIALEADQLIVKNTQADQKRMAEILADKMAEITALTDACAMSAEKVKTRMAEVEAQYAVAKEARAVADEAIKRLSIIKAENDALTAQNKAERQAIEERDRQVSIKERAFNNEYAVKKRELEDRENRIKTLEKGI